MNTAIRNPRYIPFARALLGASEETAQAVKYLNNTAWRVDPRSTGWESTKAPHDSASAIREGNQRIQTWYSTHPKVNEKVNMSKVQVVVFAVETSLDFFMMKGQRLNHIKGINLA